MMFEIIDSISDKLVDVFGKKVDGSSTFDVREWSGKFTSDVIGVCFNLNIVAIFTIFLIRERCIWT